MRLPCLRAQLRGSCETQPREAGSTYWVQVRPTFLPRLLSSLTLSRPLLPSGCPAGLLGRDRPPRATLTRPPPGAPCSRRGCSQGHLVKVREPASWDAFSALLCSPGHKRRGVLEGSRRGGERRGGDYSLQGRKFLGVCVPPPTPFLLSLQSGLGSCATSDLLGAPADFPLLHSHWQEEARLLLVLYVCVCVVFLVLVFFLI